VSANFTQHYITHTHIHTGQTFCKFSTQIVEGMLKNQGKTVVGLVVVFGKQGNGPQPAS